MEIDGEILRFATLQLGTDAETIYRPSQAQEARGLACISTRIWSVPFDALAKQGVSFVAIKENIRVEGKPDIQTKVMTTGSYPLMDPFCATGGTIMGQASGSKVAGPNLVTPA